MSLTPKLKLRHYIFWWQMGMYSLSSVQSVCFGSKAVCSFVHKISLHHFLFLVSFFVWTCLTSSSGNKQLLMTWQQQRLMQLLRSLFYYHIFVVLCWFVQGKLQWLLTRWHSTYQRGFLYSIRDPPLWFLFWAWCCSLLIHKFQF